MSFLVDALACWLVMEVGSFTLFVTLSTHWLLLWDDQKKDCNGRDSVTHNVALREQALRELDILYSYQHSVLHRNRTIFFNDPNEHKTKPTHAIGQWINTYQPLILKSIKGAKKNCLLHVRTLTHCFGAES
jgi:hypothetical protein